MRMILVACLIVMTGCGPTRMRVSNDRLVEGTVVAADAGRHSVQLRLADGRKRWLDMRTVEAVDLPGEWSIVGGGLAALAGGVLLTHTVSQPSRSLANNYAHGALIGVSSSLLVWGLTWLGLGIHHRTQTADLIDEARRP